MKVSVSSVIVLLLAIGLHSKSVVTSEDSGNPPVPNENAGEPPQINLRSSPNEPLPSNAEDTAQNAPIDTEAETSKVNTSNSSSNVNSPAPLVNEKAPDNGEDNVQSVPNDTQSSKVNISESSINETLSASLIEKAPSNASISVNMTEPAAEQNNDTITFLTTNDSNEEENMKFVRQKISKPHKSVAEIIVSNPYNNSFILNNLLNPSCDKDDVSSIGKPFNFDFIENLEFKRQLIGFRNKTTVTQFSNIHAYGIPSIGPVDTFYNNLTCTSQHIVIMLDVIPENMTFIGDYIVQDNLTNKTSNGTFYFNQTGAKLSYKIPTTSDLHNGHNLKQYGDIIYANGQVKFTQVCDNQCDLMANSAEMFTNVKSHILETLNISFISKTADRFFSAFPFLSICSSSSQTTARNYYIIENKILKTYKSSNLLLGPMILKGLDNFTNGDVIAMKNRLPNTPNRFLLSTRANHIQGQCDWHFFKNHDRNSATKHSFTFIIEEVRFSIGVNLSSESWTVDDLEISLDKISIHRSDKSCPKMLELIKTVLGDFVQDAVTDSLKGLFRQRFPELTTSMPTSTSTTIQSFTKKTRATETRQVVNWTAFRPGDNQTDTDVTTYTREHLPFPRRKVFTPCKDTRKWWQKLFYRNKCKDRSQIDD